MDVTAPAVDDVIGRAATPGDEALKERFAGDHVGGVDAEVGKGIERRNEASFGACRQDGVG